MSKKSKNIFEGNSRTFRKWRLFFKLSPTITKIKEWSRHYLVGIYDRTDQHHIFLMGGGLAFSIFVCIIPFVLIVFWLLGNFLDSSQVEIQINTLIDAIIPYESYSEFVKSVLYKRINELIEYKNIAGWIGLTGLFFAASGLFTAIRVILNQINGTDVEVNIFKGKLRDFAFIIILILLFLGSTLVFPMFETIRTIANEYSVLRFLDLPIFQQIFVSIFSTLIIFFLFAFMYRMVPTLKIRKRAVVVGALWASFFWEAAKQGFGYYLNNFADFGKIYGTYALIVVVAFWIYYSSIVFILGGEIGKLFSEKLEERIAAKQLLKDLKLAEESSLVTPITPEENQIEPSASDEKTEQTENQPT
ncbi:MAG: YihY/virulence factor BrkB family protein [Ignavibacteriaceae bacterium]|nr:YihY/virulence factor BrkB family protein [Ignavibacteriaceae bacterium]HRI45928.1 YihY/virulence factor BrkB family protein [Ignavibacteriaceae bacterium]